MLLLLWFAGRGENPGPYGFPLDDAWIHLCYGRGFAEHGYFAYNPDTPGSGCTSPLWAVCLGLVHLVVGGSADRAVTAVLALGTVLHLLTIFAATRLGRRESDLAGATAGTLVALAPALGLAAVSGMEVALTSCLLLFAIGAIADQRWWRAGGLLALAGLARPEAGAVVVLATAVCARRGWPAVAGVVAPSLAAAGALGAYHLWASGSPLPATFHAKSATSFTALPDRLATVLARMFPTIPPFGLGLGWLALLGLVPGIGRSPFPRSQLPFLGGLSFLLANLYVVDPIDPAAFYHLRYVLPSVPLLLVAVAVGSAALGTRIGGRARLVVPLALVALSAIGALREAGSQSRHHHNDVRNINEVQRRLGEWLAERVPERGWIAASDAGAVRYFSNLPTIDVIGLNTTDATARAHAVEAIAIMPAWFQPRDEEALNVVFRATTERYTVTSNPAMATQIVAVANGTTEGTVRLGFGGFRAFELDFRTPARVGP